VRVGEIKGWVPSEPQVGLASEPEVGLGDERLRSQAGRLERSRALLEGGESRRTGSVEWWTDLHPGSRLTERLSTLFECFASAYQRRYGLDLVAYSDPDRVVVFVEQEAYLRFVDSEVEVTDLASGGFSVIGFAAFYAGARHADDVAGIAAHELAHLENRRRLALELPPWLEEGLAEDMALVAAAGGDCSASGWPRISRRQWRSGEELDTVNVVLTMSGKLRALACTVEAWSASPLDLDRLASMGWEDFSRSAGRAERYAASALLVRYLLDDPSSSANRAEAFRDYLRTARDTGAFTLDRLLERLDLDAQELSRRVTDWAAAELGDLRCF